MGRGGDLAGKRKIEQMNIQPTYGGKIYRQGLDLLLTIEFRKRVQIGLELSPQITVALPTCNKK